MESGAKEQPRWVPVHTRSKSHIHHFQKKSALCCHLPRGDGLCAVHRAQITLLLAFFYSESTWAVWTAHTSGYLYTEVGWSHGSPPTSHSLVHMVRPPTRQWRAQGKPRHHRAFCSSVGDARPQPPTRSPPTCTTSPQTCAYRRHLACQGFCPHPEPPPSKAFCRPPLLSHSLSKRHTLRHTIFNAMWPVLSGQTLPEALDKLSKLLLK